MSLTRKQLTPNKIREMKQKLYERQRKKVEKARAISQSKPQKPRKPLAKVSTAKSAWNRQYSAAKKVRLAQQIANIGHHYCERCGIQCEPDGHHYRGRVGAAILDFHLLDRECHTWVHQNSNQARAEGWLAPR